MGVLAERIQQRRKQLRMSQLDLAEALDISQTQVSRYELAQNDATTEILIKLAHVLDVSTDWLLGLSENVRPDNEELDRLEKQTLDALRLTDPTKRRAVANIFKEIASLVSS